MVIEVVATELIVFNFVIFILLAMTVFMILRRSKIRLGRDGTALFGLTAFLILWVGGVVSDYPRAAAYWYWDRVVLFIVLFAWGIAAWDALVGASAAPRRLLIYVGVMTIAAVSLLVVLPWVARGWVYESQALIDPAYLVDERGRRLDAVFYSSTIARSGYWVLGTLSLMPVGIVLVWRRRAWGAAGFVGLVTLWTFLGLIIGATSVWDAMGAFGREMSGLDFSLAGLGNFGLDKLIDPATWDLSNFQMPDFSQLAPKWPWEQAPVAEVPAYEPPTEPIWPPDWWPY